MFKFYSSLVVSVVICLAYGFISKHTDEENKQDDEYVKRQLILFLTVFVITYCVTTLVYDGGLGKTSSNGDVGDLVDTSKSSIMTMDSLLENVELGEPPF